MWSEILFHINMIASLSCCRVNQGKVFSPETTLPWVTHTSQTKCDLFQLKLSNSKERDIKGMENLVLNKETWEPFCSKVQEGKQLAGSWAMGPGGAQLKEMIWCHSQRADHLQGRASGSDTLQAGWKATAGNWACSSSQGSQDVKCTLASLPWTIAPTLSTSPGLSPRINQAKKLGYQSSPL